MTLHAPEPISLRDGVELLIVLIDLSKIADPVGGYASATESHRNDINLATLDSDYWFMDSHVIKPAKEATKQISSPFTASYEAQYETDLYI